MSEQTLEALLALVFLALIILGTWASLIRPTGSVDRRVAVIVDSRSLFDGYVPACFGTLRTLRSSLRPIAPMRTDKPTSAVTRLSYLSLRVYAQV